MQLLATNARIIVTCNRGLAPCLAEEITRLGFQVQGHFNTGVETKGTLDDCIKLNLYLRCASQVMYSLRQFTCRGPEQLYRSVRQIAWDQIIDSYGYFTVNCNVSHPTIRSTMFANVKVKDAVVDCIRASEGRRPDSGAEMLGAVVYLYWRDDHAELFLDTSGQTLAKHGYRMIPGKAPMVEALAAGIVLSSRWDRITPVVNPMCGSGTLAIEAALLATGRYPGLFRQSFAFQHLLGFNQSYYKQQQEALRQAVFEPNSLTIIASDIDSSAVRNARANAKAAGVEEWIEFQVCDFRDTRIPQPGGVLFINPEYGQRLGEESQLQETYAQIGDFMKQKCGGYWGYVFTSNVQLGKRIGLKPKRKLEFHTSQLDCRLFEFELYAGSKKRPEQPSQLMQEPGGGGHAPHTQTEP